MWFRKQDKQQHTVEHPGTPCWLDGNTAAAETAGACTDVIAVGADPALAGIAEGAARRAHGGCETLRARASADALSAAAGAALEGLRADAFVADWGEGALDGLASVVGRRLAVVVHLVTAATRRQADGVHAAHDDYHAAAGTGAVALFAADPQEAADLTLIARRTAELALTPGVVATELYDTTHAIRPVLMPDQAMVDAYLGAAGEMIDAPTPAQAALLGNARRRVPVWLDADNPAGLGGVQDADSYAKAMIGRRRFFDRDVAAILDASMRAFGEMTGRRYERVSRYRTDDADIVLIAQGAVTAELARAVDVARDADRVKVGVVGVRSLRPFPGAEMSRVLRGTRVVAVTERTDVPLGDDGPLTTEIRVAVGKALENGVRGASTHDDYAAYGPGDAPVVSTAIYGVGRALPDVGDWIEAIRRLAAGTAPPLFFVGESGRTDGRRFPHLQTVEQRLHKSFSVPDGTFVTGDPPELPVSRADRCLALHTVSAQGGLFAANLFARALGESLGWDARTYPDGGIAAGMERVRTAVCYRQTASDDRRDKPGRPARADAVLATTSRQLEDACVDDAVVDGGVVLVGSTATPEAVWQSLSNRAARWIEHNHVKLFTLDTEAIAAEAASRPAFVDQLEVWAMLGAWMSLGLELGDADAETFVEGMRRRLASVFGESHYLVDDVIGALARGAEGVVTVEWASIPRGAQTEAEAPRTVSELEPGDGSVFDPTRFWHSVGYLYHNGDAHHALVDPHVATGVIPARTSAFRDLTPYRLRLPEWLPENCTGCGQCWSACPETALPPSVNGLADILTAAIGACERADGPMVQMRRVGSQLAKIMNKLMGEGTGYVAVGPLLRDGFARLVDRLNLEGDQLDVLTDELDRVIAVVDSYPLAKTDPFWGGEVSDQKLLTIALDPTSCTACGICVTECPEDAFTWVAQTDDRVAALREAARLQTETPDASFDDVEAMVAAPGTGAQSRRMLRRSVYRSMVGGDGAAPGSGAKIAVHLLTAAIESVKAPAFAAHVARLDDLVERMARKIQGDVQAAVQINDFESFRRRLARIGNGSLDADAISDLVGGEAPGIDTARLSRLTELQAALGEQRRRYTESAGGLGRARMMMVIDGVVPQGSAAYPHNPYPHPWVCHTPGEAAAVAPGVFAGVSRRIVDEIRLCRVAELELDDRYNSAEHDPMFTALDWDGLTDEERNLAPAVVVLGTPEATRWPAVSDLIDRGLPVHVVILDGGAGATGDAGGGGDRFGTLALARRDCFVLQTAVGDPEHLLAGVAAGVRRAAPTLFHIHAPDALTSGILPERVVESARLAIASRTFPVFVFDSDEAPAENALAGNPSPEAAWAEHDIAVTDPSGNAATVTTTLTPGDWVVGQGRYHDGVRFVGRGRMNDRMKPLWEYVQLSAEERGGFEPFVHVAGDKGRHLLAIVGEDVVALTERVAAVWRRLQLTLPSEGTAAADELVPAPAAVGAAETGDGNVDDAYRRLTDRLLAMSGYGDSEFFKQTLRDFVTGDKGADED